MGPDFPRSNVYVAWGKCVRKVMYLPYMTRNLLLPFVCDDISIIIEQNRGQTRITQKQ